MAEEETESTLPFGAFDICDEGDEEEKQIPYEQYGFTDEEFAVTLKVLACIAKESAELKLYNEKRMKPLRSALLPFLSDIRGKLPKDFDKYRRRKEAKALRNARKQRQKRQDAKYIDASKLRAKRLQDLQALQSAGQGEDIGSRLLVSDGQSLRRR